MSRITKKPEERKNELIDVAEELFSTIGYRNTSVSDIVKKVSVAQGTFYYYFKSKEDICVSIFQRHLEKTVNEFNKIISNSSISAIKKLEKLIEVDINFNKEGFVSILHDEEYSILHRKFMIYIIDSYKPIVLTIINQGIAEGVFKTEFADEIAEFFLVNANFLFDPELFSWSRDEYIKKINAFSCIMGKSLDLHKASFNFIDSFKTYLNK